MQPNFTQKNLWVMCMKSFAVALLFILGSQFSYAQQPANGARPREEKKVVVLTKEQKAQQKTSSVTSDNDAGIPNSSVSKVSFGPVTNAVCATFTGDLSTGDQTMALRLFRGGPGTGTTCAAAGVFPTTAGTGPYFYDVYTFTNPQAVTQCVTVTLKTTDINSNIQSAVYLTTFDPTNLATNYLGDAGTSTAGTTANLVFQFNIPGSAVVKFVVFNTVASSPVTDYVLTVDGVCTACVPTNATAPVISSVPSTTCSGSPITLSVISGNLNGAAAWKWYSGSCGGTLVGTGNSITVSPVATTTYYARGEGGCAPANGPCGSQIVTVTPCTCISPDLASICAGSVQRLRINGTGPASFTDFPSGAITVAIPDNSPAGISHVIPVAGLPAGATITSVTANFNITHTFDGDLVINLKAPNGQVINMVNARGGSGDNFVNTTISSASATSLATGVAPFTGTFKADGALNAGPTSFLSTTSNFADLFTAGNGNWTIALRDVANLDAGTLTSWTLTINYTIDPSGLWAGPAGTLFSDPAATIPYITGTQANSVWVKSTIVGANAYTATLASGPCAGVNNITVNVLAKPVVTISPAAGGCSPITLTASGASIYNWTPAAGLNTTTGPTVIATVGSNTTFSVVGIGANGCTADVVTVPVTGAPTASVISSLGTPPTIIFSDGFDGTIPPASWSITNNSAPVGTTTWTQGGALGVFTPQSGAGFASANFNNTGNTGTISNWFFAPSVTLANGDKFVFWSRAATGGGAFPDRLQVRMSTSGTSTNVGATATSVGDFTNLLLDINPTYTATGYPEVWTQFTATVTGLAAPTAGRIAFRYFVENAGFSGLNSNFIGVDNVEYQRPPLATCANTTSFIKVDITGGTSPYTLVYSNGTISTTFAGYTSGTPIQVSPSATTTYTIVSVTGANGCVGTGNSGSAVITVTPPPAITVQPVNKTACVAGTTTFTVTATPALGTTYQWQVSTNGGGLYTDLTDVAPYSGVTTATLTITNATAAMNLNMYRVRVTGYCPPTGVTSTAATLFVNSAPTITTAPVATTKCVGTNATFTVVASTPAGPAAPTYQWQVSTNNGGLYTNITGATAATLTLTGVTAAMTNNLYQVIITTAPCAATVTSVPVKLTVNTLPVVSITSSVTQLIPGRTATLTATSTPAATSYTWTKNGVTVAGATGSTLVVGIDDIGTYRATGTDANTCAGTSNALVIGTEASDKLWIYPNPTDGVFQVRLFQLTDFPTRREVSVYNSTGQMVAHKSFDFVRGMSPYYKMDFDLSALAPGTYLVKATEKNTTRIIAGLVVIQ